MPLSPCRILFLNHADLFLPKQRMAQDRRPATASLFLSGWQPRRRLGIRLGRRRTVPTIRLGAERPRRGRLILRSVWRRMRLRWLKMQYRCLLQRLKTQYRKLMAEMVEARASVEAFQQRAFMEASCAVPVMAGVSFTSFRSASGPVAMIMWKFFWYSFAVLASPIVLFSPKKTDPVDPIPILFYQSTVLPHEDIDLL